MPRKCFSVGCKTGYASEWRKNKELGIRNHSLFLPPKDPKIFYLWQKSIPRADRMLTMNDRVCEKHFKEEDIITHFEIKKLPDGKVFRMLRGTKTLKRDAVPCIFTNVPGHSSYLTDKCGIKKRKQKCKLIKTEDNSNASEGNVSQGQALLKDNENCTTNDGDPPAEETCRQTVFTTLTNKDIAKDDTLSILLSALKGKVPYKNCATTEPTSPNQIEILEQNDGESTSMSPVSSPVNFSKSSEIEALPDWVSTKQFSFNFLKLNLNTIEKPNSWWAVNAVDNFIICARWTSDWIVEKKIIINEDLTVRVFLKDRETAIGKDLKIQSIRNISFLIARIERTLFCSEIENRENNCDGYLQGTRYSRLKKLCSSCIKWQREKAQQEKEHVNEERLQEKLDARKNVELIKFHFNFS